MSIFAAHGPELAFWLKAVAAIVTAASVLIGIAIRVAWKARDILGNIYGELQAHTARFDQVDTRLDTLNGQVIKNTRFREDHHEGLIAAQEASARVTAEAMARLEEMRRERKAG